MKTFQETLNQQLKDSAFKKEYEALEPEYQLIRSLLDNRKAKKITQQELSSRTGIPQADISRIEHGEYNPSLQMMKRLANGLDMKLNIAFMPTENE